MKDTDKKGCCAEGERKVAVVIQDKSVGINPKTRKKNWNDYHWYRQEPDGSWTHKRGAKKTEDKDASGKPIKDPSKADRNYPGTPDYDKFCGYLCVPYGMDLENRPKAKPGKAK